MILPHIIDRSHSDVKSAADPGAKIRNPATTAKVYLTGACDSTCEIVACARTVTGKRAVSTGRQ